MPKVSDGKLIDIWSVEDVQTVAPGLNDQQALEVLHRLNHDYDSEYGINNQVIHGAAEYLYPGSTEEVDETPPGLPRVQFRDCLCDLHITTYGTTGAPALELYAAKADEDTMLGEPIATATVNMPEIQLKPGQVIIKDCSENEGMYAELRVAGVVEPALRLIDVGQAINGGVICSLSTEFAKKVRE